jgi:hypothetical protein
MERIAYDCVAKSRVIEPSVFTTTGTPPNNAYVEVRMVYELRDCVESARP